MASAYGLNPITTPSDEDPTANQSPRVMGASIVLIVVPTTVVLLRCLARYLSKAGFWWDDYLVLFSWICAVGLNSVQIYSLRVGFGQHMAADGDVFNRLAVAENWFKIFYAYQFLYAVSITAAKFSILLFYQRIFKERQFTLWLRFLMLFTALFYVSNQLVIIFECIPIASLWDPFIEGTCINIIQFFVASGAVNVLLNCAILFMPLPMVWSLDIDRRHRLALSGVFLLGCFVVIVAIARVAVISQLAIVDITWEFVDAALWTAAEPSIAVTSASLPILRSLWVWNRRKRADRYGADSPDSYEETKSSAEGPRPELFQQRASVANHKIPIDDAPAVGQSAYGNQVVIASNGQSRKVSHEAENHGDLHIMQPQEATMVPRPAPPSQTWHSQRPPAQAVPGPSAGLPPNRSELYG